eukprot:GHVU01189284.1.p2 GENE.GHVU01189284.1~~GHVU01189284.1.p2  ORF type:complete len:286 (+),score=72.15 GHVU01189284.1:329-1186(+)
MNPMAATMSTDCVGVSSRLTGTRWVLLLLVGVAATIGGTTGVAAAPPGRIRDRTAPYLARPAVSSTRGDVGEDPADAYDHTSTRRQTLKKPPEEPLRVGGEFGLADAHVVGRSNGRSLNVGWGEQVQGSGHAAGANGELQKQKQKEEQQEHEEESTKAPHVYTSEGIEIPTGAMPTDAVPPPPSSDGGMSAGAAAGIAFASLTCAGVLGGVGWWAYKQKKASDEAKEAAQEGDEDEMTMTEFPLKNASGYSEEDEEEAKSKLPETRSPSRGGKGRGGRGRGGMKK